MSVSSRSEVFLATKIYVVISWVVTPAALQLETNVSEVHICLCLLHALKMEAVRSSETAVTAASQLVRSQFTGFAAVIVLM